MTRAPLGVGFVGAGFITETFHAETFRGIRDADVAGVMNPTVEKAERVAANCRDAGTGDPETYGEVRDLVTDPDVEALWVTSPNHTRVETVEAIVEEIEQGNADLRGIAVEKPLARTVAEAERVVELIEGAGIANAYLENQVFMPGIERMRDLLWEAGRDAGRPYLARAAEEHSGPHSAWFWDPSRQGGGVLNDMMCHSHKVNKHLLEDPDADGGLDPVAATGQIATLKWRRGEYAAELREEYGVDYDDSPGEDYARAAIVYETPDGERVVGEATNSWCFVGSGLRITVELLGPEYSGSINTLESGTEVFLSGSLEEDGGYVVEKGEAGQGSMPVLPDEATTYGYLAQNRHIVESFREGENAREDVRDGLEVVRLCMASYKAAEEGEQVPIDGGLSEYVPEPARGEFDGDPVA